MSLLYLCIWRYCAILCHDFIMRLYHGSFISSFSTTFSSSLVIFGSFYLIIIWSFSLKGPLAYYEIAFYLLLRPFLQNRYFYSGFIKTQIKYAHKLSCYHATVAASIKRIRHMYFYFTTPSILRISKQY